MIVDLKDFRSGTGAPEALPKGTDVSRFKEPSANRIVAPAMRHIVYSLKDASKLRVVHLAGGSQGGPAASQSFDKHTAPVKAAQFMNQKSNIVASFSEKELIVWVIPKPAGEGEDAGKTVPVSSIVFNAAPVTAFAWCAPRDSSSASSAFADIVATTADGRVVQIPIATLHHDNMQDASGTVRQAPAQTIAVPISKCQVLCKQIAKNEGGKAFAAVVADVAPSAVVASADGKSAVICRDGGSIKWRALPDEEQFANETIVDITVLSAPKANSVVIATQSFFTVWDVSGPAPTNYLTVQTPLLVRKATATNSRLVLCLGIDSNPNQISFAAVAFGYNPKQNSMNVRGMTVRNFDMEGVPFVPSLCAIQSNPNGDDPFITMDSGKAISIYSLPAFYSKPTNAASGASPQQQQHQPLPQNLVPPSDFSHNNQHGAPRAPMPRSAVGGGGGGASEEFAQFENMLAPMHRHLAQRSNTVNSKLTDLQFVLPEDHGRLLDSVLNEQRELLVATVQAAFENVRANNAGASSSSSAGGKVQLDEESSAQISEMVIRGVTDAIVENVARGISESLNQSLARRVEGLVSTAINRYTKKVRKAQEKEGNKNAEVVAVEILAAAQRELESKNKEAGMQLLLQLQQLNKPATDTLQKMQRIIEQQQRFIDKFTDSGILEELRRLKVEVEQLRSASAAGAASGPNKTTMLARAKAALDSGSADQALAWILPLNDPQFTLSLLSSIDAERLSDLIEQDTSVPQERWVRAATDMAQVVDPALLEAALQVLQEITLSERVALTSNGRAKQVLQAFIGHWKAQGADLSQDVRGLLRDVSMALR